MSAWTARARWHGKRLAQKPRHEVESLVGILAYHEGADVTVAAMRDFRDTLIDAYVAEQDALHTGAVK